MSGDRSPLRLTDLDEQPDLLGAVLRLYARFGPGRYHAVNGEPWRMGQVPRESDLLDTMGCLVALVDGEVAGACTVCPYSERQATLWGPVVGPGHQGHSIGPLLLQTVRTVLATSGYDSIRVLNDERNRRARAFFLAHGMSPWKRNHIYERDLSGELPAAPPGVSPARPEDHGKVESLILKVFPETGHCDQPLTERERQGYRHHLLQHGGQVVAAATVRSGGPRSWLSLLAVHPEHRRRGYGRDLVCGVMRAEAATGADRIALEVLADNRAANNLYADLGFHRAWSMHILVGPL